MNSTFTTGSNMYTFWRLRKPSGIHYYETKGEAHRQAIQAGWDKCRVERIHIPQRKWAVIQLLNREA